MPDAAAPKAPPSVRERLRDAVAPRLRVALRAGALVVPVLTLLVVSWEWNGIPGQPLRDSYAYYDAARSAAGSASIYDSVGPGPHEFREGRYLYVYPPPLAAGLALLPPVEYRAFDRAWLVLSLLSFWVFAAALARIARGRWSVYGTLDWGAAAFFLPGAWIGIHFGNIEMMILALVALALAVAPVAGFALALGAIFKMTPLWPFLVRSWRVPRATWAGAAIAFGICAGACLAVFGFAGTVDETRHWVEVILPTISQGQFWGESLTGLRSGQLKPFDYLGNLSLSFLPVQLAVLNGWPYEGGELPAAVRVWLTTVAVGGPLLAAWLTRRRGSTLQAAVVFAAALLCGPIVRPYVVVPAMLLVLAAARRERFTANSGTSGRDVAAG